MADSPEVPARDGGWPLSGRQTVALLVSVVVVVFMVQNTDDAVVELFGVDVEAPLWLVLAAIFGIGVLVGMLLQRRRTRSKP